MHAVNRKSLFLSVAVTFVSFFVIHSSFAQGTAFLYQGQLGSGGTAANGNYDFQFTVYNAVTNGSAVSPTLTDTNIGVTNGLFTVALDFGPNIFTGPSLWLAIDVRTNGSVTFTPLWPLQPVLATPYAIFANSASNLVGTLSGSAFAGFTNSVSLTNGANLFSGTFSGNGGSVTNVNVSNLTGILVDSQLPSNTAFLNSNQTFTASNTFTGNNTFNGGNVFTNLRANSFSGSFFGNGLVGWIVVSGTTQQAQIDHGYLLTNSQVVTVTLPTNASPGDIVRIAGAGAIGWQAAQNANQSVLGNFITYGKTWTQSSQGPEQWDSLASSSDGTKMVAAVYGSGGFISVNSGATWSEPFTTAAQCDSVASSADGTHLFIAVTNGGFLYYSTNSGSSGSWTGITGTDFGGVQWTSVACSSSGYQLVAADSGGGLLVYSGTPPTLVNSYANASAWSAVASSANGSNLVAAVYGGDIYISSSAGASSSWSAVSPNGSTANWKAVASSASGTVLVAAAYGGGIYTSSNGGTNWSQSSAPTGNWVSAATSSDGSKMIAAAQGGGIYTSANWGETWTPQTNSLSTTANWACVTSSSSGATLAAGIYSTLSPDGLYTSQAASQTTTTTGTGGYISGSQGSAAELQCIATNEFMPISSVGTIWGN